ncbi:MAG TPA: hypothetical protein VIW92_09665, partial [Thermoanaerobaculia bacterium]
YSRDYERAMARIEDAPEEVLRVQDFLYPRALLRAHVQTVAGRPDLARSSWEEARRILEEEVRRNPGDSMAHSSLGVAYAGLGRKADAVREGQRALDIENTNRDAFIRDNHLIHLAWIYVLTGDREAAIREIESLTRQPSLLTVPLLRVDPRWDLLRGDPRFQRLLTAAPASQT